MSSMGQPEEKVHLSSIASNDVRRRETGLGVFSSQIGVFPSRGVSFSQIGVFGSRGVSGSQVLVFPVPGLVFSLPSSCVGVFGSQVWVFSVLDNVFPARLLCWCALSRVCLSAFV